MLSKTINGVELSSGQATSTRPDARNSCPSLKLLFRSMASKTGEASIICVMKRASVQFVEALPPLHQDSSMTYLPPPHPPSWTWALLLAHRLSRARVSSSAFASVGWHNEEQIAIFIKIVCFIREFHSFVLSDIILNFLFRHLDVVSRMN